MGRRLPILSVIRRLVPHSLRTRLILLVLGTILIVQAATLATVAHYRREFTETTMVDVTTTTIRTLQAALVEMSAERRAEFIRQSSQNEWYISARTLPSQTELERRSGEQARHGQHKKDPPEGLRRELWDLVQAINTRLDENTRVGLSRGPVPKLFISLPPDPQADKDAPQIREWLVIPLDSLAPPVATPLIAAWLAGMGLVLLLAAAFSWHIARPLTRLARAADQLAAGQPQRVTPAGPSETRALGQRFNAMLDALAESDAVRRTLLAGLPHDLKGPLSRMWLRIEMMDESALKDGLRHDVQEMQRMVNQFIGFVRGTDPASYRFTPLALNEWLEEQVSAWESAGSTVRWMDQTYTPLTLAADSLALGRLMDNLITNALDHGAPPVDVRLDQVGDQAVITVSDHGVGICPERRDEALRPFSRLDDARTQTGSVGLGLALCEAIAKAHGGSLSLGEAVTGGLAVSIRLPLSKAVAATETHKD